MLALVVPGAAAQSALAADADMLAVSSGSPSFIYPFEGLTYTVGAKNLGPDTAQSVILTDTLPPGFDFGGVDNPACSEAGGIVTCNFGNMVNGKFFQANISLTSNGTAFGSLLNTTNVASPTNDPNPANNNSYSVTTIPGTADVGLTMTTLTASPISAGDNVQYNLHVVNNGPDSANNVRVTDSLPFGTSFVSGDDCAESGGTITCDFGTLANGAAVDRVLTLGTTASAGPSVNNFGSVATDDNDFDFSNQDSFPDAVTFNTAADITVSQSGPADIPINSNMTYALQVHNNGPTDATGVVLTDTLPANTTFVSEDSGSCTEAPVGTLTCPIADAIPPNGDVFRNITVSTTPASQPSITNNVHVDPGPEPDPDLGNNDAAPLVTTISEAADIALTNTASPPVDTPLGTTVVYTLTATNNGPSTAMGVVVTDTLAPGTTFKADGTDADCVEAPAGTVTCDFGDMNMSDSASKDMAVTVDTAAATGPADNTAVAGLTGPGDPVPDNNTAIVTSNIVDAADLSVDASGTPGNVAANGKITYTVQVSNAGPSNATGVKITDALPSGLTFFSASPGCGLDSGTVTCQVGDLASGASASRDVTLRAHGDAIPLASNTFSASGDQFDPQSGNDSDSVTTDVAPGAANLGVTLNGTPASVHLGEQITYTVNASNTGPTNATSVVAADVLPAGLSFANGDAGCSAAGAMVTCDFGAVGEDDTASKQFVVDVTPAAFPSVANKATIAGAEPDNTPANNTSNTVTTTVEQISGPSADLSITNTSTPPSVTAGADVAYVLSVHNDGPSVANGVVASDVLPAGTSYKPNGTSAGCLHSAGTVNCSFGSVAVGATETKKIIVKTTGITTASVVNHAIVTGTEPDPDATNNSADATTAFPVPGGGAAPAKPSVTIGKIRAAKGKARVTFQGSGDFGSFKCQVDAAEPVDCLSPSVLRVRKSGRHKLTVLVYDKSGALASSATRNFVVKKAKKKKKRKK